MCGVCHMSGRCMIICGVCVVCVWYVSGRCMIICGVCGVCGLRLVDVWYMWCMCDVCV